MLHLNLVVVSFNSNLVCLVEIEVMSATRKYYDHTLTKRKQKRDSSPHDSGDVSPVHITAQPNFKKKRKNRGENSVSEEDEEDDERSSEHDNDDDERSSEHDNDDDEEASEEAPVVCGSHCLYQCLVD